MTADEFRSLALGMTDAVEGSHNGHPDFRVGGKIFASLGYPRLGFGMVKLTPEQQEAVVREEPTIFAPAKGAWGKAGSTTVRLPGTRKSQLRPAMLAAWRNRAPKGLAESGPA